MNPADFVNTLGRTLGLSFAAGINLYATVVVIGFASRFGWVELPEQYRVFDNNWVIGVALFLYLVEFVADKIPWVDSLWDAIHTVIRPIGGALIAVASIGHAQPVLQGMAALAGALVAARTPAAKNGTPAGRDTKTRPSSNWGPGFFRE